MTFHWLCLTDNYIYQQINHMIVRLNFFINILNNFMGITIKAKKTFKNVKYKFELSLKYHLSNILNY